MQRVGKNIFVDRQHLQSVASFGKRKLRISGVGDEPVGKERRSDEVVRFVAEQIEVQREKLGVDEIDAAFGLRKRIVRRADETDRRANCRKSAVASHVIRMRYAGVQPSATRQKRL